MTWTTSDIPDLSGKVAVVTGANSGLGLESVRALAGAGAHVVMAARSRTRAQSARDDVLAQDAGASLELVDLDLGSLESVKEAAATITSAHPVVDILINNAGLMALPEGRTEDGFETQFGVNHLGHWAFTAGLLPSLLAAEAARVVTVSSLARFQGSPVDPDNVNMEGEYSPWPAYGRSKLANYHFAIGLQREFEKRGLRAQSLAAHPGLSNTNLQANTVEQGGGGMLGDLSHSLVGFVGMSAARGALPQLRAATDPKAKGGELYGPAFGSNGPPVKRPVLAPGLDGAIETLWMVSERETGIALDFDAASRS